MRLFIVKFYGEAICYVNAYDKEDAYDRAFSKLDNGDFVLDDNFEIDTAEEDEFE